MGQIKDYNATDGNPGLVMSILGSFSGGGTKGSPVKSSSDDLFKLGDASNTQMPGQQGSGMPTQNGYEDTLGPIARRIKAKNDSDQGNMGSGNAGAVGGILEALL